MPPESVAFLRKLGLLTLVLIVLGIVYQLRTLLGIVAFSIFLTILFSPALATMQRWRIPNVVGILLIYGGILLLAATVFATTLPIFATQFLALFSRISDWAEHLQ